MMTKGVTQTQERANNPAAAAATAEPARTVPVFLPATDVWETKESLVIQAELPGADPDSLEVGVDRGVLRIAARTRMAPPAGYSLIHGEYRDGDYERSFTLSTEIATDRIEAAWKDGLLTLVLPKAAPPATRRIAVKVA